MKDNDYHSIIDKYLANKNDLNIHAGKRKTLYDIIEIHVTIVIREIQKKKTRKEEKNRMKKESKVQKKNEKKKNNNKKENKNQEEIIIDVYVGLVRVKL